LGGKYLAFRHRLAVTAIASNTKYSTFDLFQKYILGANLAQFTNAKRNQPNFV
jgi:hypothetical protein